MRYPMPNYPCEFEIPDAWLEEAGMDGFTRTAPAYRSTAAAVPVSLREIEPPPRTRRKRLAWLRSCPIDLSPDWYCEGGRDRSGSRAQAAVERFALARAI